MPKPAAQNIAVTPWEKRGMICELCGRSAQPMPRTGKQRRPHLCPHGTPCVRGHRLLGRHQNHPLCRECAK